MGLVSRRLSWDDVSPERRQLDLGLARAALESVVERALYLRLDEFELEERIDEELIWHFGVWLTGWRSGPEGGPVRAYDPLFSRNALLREGQTDTEPTVRLTLQTLVEWQEYLEALDLHFAALPDPPDVGRAAARMLGMIRAKTGGREGWQSTLAQALIWYFESRGLRGGHYRRALREAVDRGFSGSGTGAETEAGALERAFEMPSAPPQLPPWQQWLAVRRGFPRFHWGDLGQVGPLRQDGHLEHIERKERDPRLLAALKFSRGWAEGEEPLTFSVLRRWHKMLGAGEAIELEAQLDVFVSKLQEAGDPEISPDWRAATAYLDIRHAGLFSEGNHRLARLALDALLWRAGFALNSVAPVFVVGRAVHEESGAGPLASLVNSLIGRRPVAALEG